MKKITNEYLAGILDGEGYIGIAERKILGRKNYWSRVCIVLSNRGGSYSVLREFNKRFGGKIYRKKSYFYNLPNGTRKRPRFALYVFEIHHKQAREMLLSLLPYLLIKKKQAILAIKLFKSYSTGRNKPLPKEEVKRRKIFYLQIKKLNR